MTYPARRGRRGGVAGPRPAARLKAGLALAAALLAGACATGQVASTAEAEKAAAAPVVAPPASPASPATAELPPAPAPQTAPKKKEAPAPAPKEAEEASPHPTPARLLGMAPTTVRGWLGSPTLLRRDPPAEIWQYARPGCVLFLFLYEDRQGANQVWYYELRPRKAADLTDFGDPAASECFARLIERRDRPLHES